MNRAARFSRDIMIAWTLWAASLFLPAAGLRANGALLRGDVMFSGWEIVSMILSDPPRTVHDFGRIAAWLMVMTNLIMLASPVVEITERPRVRLLFKVLATAAAGLNVFAALPYAPLLSYGYLVWLGSFIVLARALWQGRRF